MRAETIVASATPRGISALAIIRVSGPMVPELIDRHLSPALLKAPRKQVLTKFKTSEGKELDSCLACFYERGQSYTGEEMLEISCHGNPLIIDLAQQVLRDSGCRMAEPGEFTRRAFLNGKLTLPQAEAVQDVIASRGERALEIAQQHLEGSSGKRLLALYEGLLESLAEIEAYLDFPEEDLPEENHRSTLARLDKRIEESKSLSASPLTRQLLFEGIRLAILGAPNAGKSSLLNQFLGQERAIVSETPGTTRDYIKEEIDWNGFRIQFLDTAGLRLTSNEIEAAGISRSREMIGQADAYLLLIARDGGIPEGLDESDIPLRGNNLLVVETKTDLPLPSPAKGPWANHPQVELSLKDESSWNQFKQTFSNFITQLLPPDEEDRLVLNQRQTDCLQTCIDHLYHCRAAFKDGLPEVAGSEMRLALESFALIVGKFDHEKMLDHLFGNFCIGK